MEWSEETKNPYYTYVQVWCCYEKKMHSNPHWSSLNVYEVKHNATQNANNVYTFTCAHKNAPKKTEENVKEIRRTELRRRAKSKSWPPQILNSIFHSPIFREKKTSFFRRPKNIAVHWINDGECALGTGNFDSTKNSNKSKFFDENFVFERFTSILSNNGNDLDELEFLI